MRRLLALWFRLDVPVSRRAYALTGFGLMAFKYAVEAGVILAVTGHALSPLDYLNPLLTVRQVALRDADWLLWAIAAWTLPFLWIGVSMTLRRAEDAGLSPAVALLYFLPVVNYVVMVALCVVPRRRGPAVSAPAALPPAPAPRSDPGAFRAALAGAGLAVGFALAMVGTSVLAFGAYGTTLFAATPFVMGAAAAFVYNRPLPRPVGATVAVAELAVIMAGGAILLFALEGVLCLLMAAPIALAMAFMGALLGRWLAITGGLAPRSAALVLALPILSAVDGPRPAGLVEVASAIDIAAPPERVWPNVVSFAELPEPPTGVFRLGIAYPVRARIEGRGPGAVRRCEFSTGAFLEPITAWEEPRRLAFDVVRQPAPLQEWSPYARVWARHLDGYLRVARGEFRLEALAGGGTRLHGSTWYAVEMAPAAYWSLWSDAIIHAIHGRVLAHIKRLAES